MESERAPVASARQALAYGSRIGETLLPRWVRPAVSVGVFALLPALLTARLMLEHGFGWDFRAMYAGAHAYMNGVSPFPQNSLAALSSKQGFVYPAATALLLSPLALLPYGASLALWIVISVASIAVGLWVLGVRDWRCFGALMLTLPAESSLRLGTLSPILLLLLALLWHYRNRLLLTGAIAAVLAVSKVFLFPMLFWLAITRRARAAALAAALGAGLCLVAWLPLGESTITSYPALLRTLADFEDTFSYSLTSLGVGLGLAPTAATTLAWTAAAAVLLFAYRRRTDENFAFRLTLAACFLLSPIVWGHYFLLLAAPLALRWPRLGPAWILAIWLRSDTLAIAHPTLWAALALVVMAAQLDLLWLRRAFAWVVPTGSRMLVALAVVGALQLESLASAQAGYTSTAPLTRVLGARHTSGAVSIRIQPRKLTLCWLVWTRELPHQTATLTIEPVNAVGEHVLHRTLIGADGEASGCAPLDREDTLLARNLALRPRRYRVLVAVPQRALLTGTLQRN